MEDRGISLSVLDNINIKFIDMDPMNGDSRLNIETHIVKIKKMSEVLELLTETFVKKGILRRSWRCLISLRLMLMKVFKAQT